jgi:tetratricopeptide (TPR) repeat protein
MKATEKIFSELISDLSPNPTQIIELSNAFRSKNKTDFALKTLEKGRKLLRDSYPLNVQFAEIYASNGDFENMFKELINLLELSITQKSAVQNTLLRFIDFANPESKEFVSLKSVLLEKTQKNMDNIIYSEMLIWFYIQSANFSAAITQSIALDKRFNYAGEYVLEVGKMALENRNYEQARKAFKYVISLGQEYPFYSEAERLNLNVRFTELTSNRNYTQQEIDETIKEFQQTIARLGAKRSAFELGIELAYIQAYFGNKSTDAIALLNELVSLPGLTDIQKASGKMLLADIFVLQGEIWDASILYMQIDTDFKYEIIGQEAKYKNARIYYYDGEFDFAQSQLSVLKESTSRLIANDAIQLSTLITDNFGLDSNFQIMGWFAQGDLQLEQHKYTEAFSYYDSVLRAEPGHSLEDEILYRKAKAMELQGRWDDAIPFLEKIVSNFGNDILADDALFRLADIYEIQKGDKEKALEYFKKILLNYKGSLYSTEARKRLRILRGEKVIDGENDIENK